MKREIKFRGRNVKHGWLTGYYFVNRGVHFIVEDGIADPLNTWEDYAVDPDTVGQYTGLEDRNGREIYEGDILMCIGQRGDNKGHKYYRMVLFENGSFCMNVRYYRINSPLCNHIVTIVNKELDWEVIGNIHDNPELLEEEK